MEEFVGDLMVAREEVVFVDSRNLGSLEEHWRKGEW